MSVLDGVGQHPQMPAEVFGSQGVLSVGHAVFRDFNRYVQRSEELNGSTKAFGVHGVAEFGRYFLTAFGELHFEKRHGSRAHQHVRVVV